MQQFAKNRLEVPHAPQIMGGFGATGQNNPKRRNKSAELLIDLPGYRRPCAREGTSREENRITAIRQPIPGEEPRSSQGLIPDEISVGSGIERAGIDVIATDLQKQRTGIDPLRTHRRTEPAKGCNDRPSAVAAEH